MKKEICIIYDSSHIDEVHARANLTGATIVCLDFWVGRELKKRNISFISLPDLKIPEDTEEEWWVLAQDVAREWYRLSSMEFFEYDGIRIGEALEPILELYLSRLFYYVRIYAALKGEYPDASFYIPVPIVNDVSAGAGLIYFERWAVIDAARMAGLETIVLSERAVPPQKHLFPRTVWKSFLVRAYNAIVGLAPRRSLKIYASEYWSHIGSVIMQMDDAELVLMEVSELKHISWRQIIKHRIRIKHPADATSGQMKRKAMAGAEEYMKQWGTVKKDVAQYLSGMRPELDWSPVLEACEYFITYSPRVIADIDALHRIMEEEKPNVVLQLASVGGRRHHFFLMAHIAAQLKISSIELQHAGAYIDPRSAYSRIETDYLATYGSYTNSWYERIGYSHERLVSIGSPRFDRCLNGRSGALEKGKLLFKQFGLDTTRPTVLVAVPFSSANLFALDSWQLAAFFEAIYTAKSKIPGLQVLFKFRGYSHVGVAREYLQELFPADMAIAGNEDLFALLCASDSVVCGNSTVLYEAMLAQKPLVFFSWKKFDTYHAQAYAPAAPFAYAAEDLSTILQNIFNDTAYRNELLAQGQQFLKGYSFDGKSVERMISFLSGKL